MRGEQVIRGVTLKDVSDDEKLLYVESNDEKTNVR